MEKECGKCGGRGYIHEKVDGKHKRSVCSCVSVSDFRVKIENEHISLHELREKIPNKYFRDVEFDEEELRESICIPNELKDIQIESYIDFIKSYLATLRMGSRPGKSYFVSAPSGSGKKVFVYTAIKEALRGGLKPSGLLDTHEVYDLMATNQFGKIKELLSVDVAFLTMGGSPARPDIIALRSIIDICERGGVPLLIISRFTANFLTKNDVTLKTDLGLFTTRRGDYGRLEQVGFNDETMYKYMDVLRKNTGSEKVESVSDMKRRMREENGGN